MIALQDNLPLVKHRDRYTTEFQRDWLHASVLQAAEQAGYEKWWLAEHVVESVVRYLQDDFEGTVVSTTAIKKCVRSILQGIGYAEIAMQYAPSAPPVLVPLSDLADQLENGYELAFFQMLDHTIDRLVTKGASNIRFCGLHYSVKTLFDAKRWRKSCSELQDEIVIYIRSRLQGRCGDQNITFTLS